MVDAVNGAGGSQNSSQINRAQNNNNRSSDTQRSGVSASQQDEVQLSEEAISLSEAEQRAAQTRAILEEQSDEVLSSGDARIDALI